MECRNVSEKNDVFAVLGRSCCCEEMASEEAHAELDKVQAELAQRASSFGVHQNRKADNN
jgi:hypothetical protein